MHLLQYHLSIVPLRVALAGGLLALSSCSDTKTTNAESPESSSENTQIVSLEKPLLPVVSSKSEVISLLAEAKRWNDEVELQYLGWAKQKVLADCKAKGVRLDDALVNWVEKNLSARQAVYGAVSTPDYRIFSNLQRIYSELGHDLFVANAELCLGSAVARRTIGVGEIANANFSLKLSTVRGWVEEAKVPYEKVESFLARRGELDENLSTQQQAAQAKVNAFIDQNGGDANALYADTAMQPKLLDVIKSVSKKPSRDIFPYLRRYMVKKGLRPSNRSPHPRVADFIKHLDTILKVDASSMSLEKGQKWPVFPTAKSPWPVLMPLAITWPLDEAKYVFEKYQGKHDGKRFHTYGPYKRFPKNEIPKLVESKWHWASFPSKIKSGGLCGTMTSVANGTKTSLGSPIIKAGQPGHSALVAYGYSGGRYYSNVGQSATAGPDGTKTDWLFADTLCHRSAGKTVVRAEHHYGLALGMNLGCDSYLRTHMGYHVYRGLSDSQKRSFGDSMLLGLLKKNPYHVDAWYALVGSAESATQAVGYLRQIEQNIKAGGTVEETEIRSADTDLTKVSKTKDGQDPVEKCCATLRKILVKEVIALIVANGKNYSSADTSMLLRLVEGKVNAGDASYLTLLDQCRVQVDGASEASNQMLAEFKKYLKTPIKGRKPAKTAAKNWIKRVDGVRAFGSEVAQKLLESMLAAVPENKKVITKKGNKVLHPLYGALCKSYTSVLKSMPTGRKLLEKHSASVKALLK